MGGLLGIWNWMKGNAKCPECGSYDTAIYEEKFLDFRQAWRTDFGQPRNQYNARPQIVFNETYIQVNCNCNDCKHKFHYNDVKIRRA